MNPAWYTPIGACVLALLGWLLQQWTRRIDRDARQATRTDIADKVSEVWERTSQRLDLEVTAMTEKASACEKRLRENNERLKSRDQATYNLLERMRVHDETAYRVLETLERIAAPTLTEQQRFDVNEDMTEMRRQYAEMQTAARVMREAMYN